MDSTYDKKRNCCKSLFYPFPLPDSKQGSSGFVLVKIAKRLCLKQKARPKILEAAAL